jgi:hypothetical protein
MSRTFSTNCGSVESLKLSLRCGCSENAFQMRCTVETDRPDAFAIERVLQCVARDGIVSSVCVHHIGNLVVPNFARRAATRLVIEAVEALRGKPSAPYQDRHPRDADFVCDSAVVQTIGRQKDNRGARRIGPRDLATPRSRLQLASFCLAENESPPQQGPSSPPGRGAIFRAALNTLGACISFDSAVPVDLPDKFDLTFDNGRSFWSCHVIWRNKNVSRVGVTWKNWLRV